MIVQQKSPAFGSYQTNFSKLKPHAQRMLTDIFQGNTDCFLKATKGTKVMIEGFQSKSGTELILRAKPHDMRLRDKIRYFWDAVKSLVKGDEVFPAKKVIHVQFSQIGLVPSLEKHLDGISTVALTEYGEPSVAAKILAKKFNKK